MTRRNRSHQSVERIRQAATRIAFVIGGLFAVALTVSFFFDEMGVRRYVAMQKHARELELEIKEMEQTNGALRIEVKRIQHDPARIEELARERLGFVKKGETVYQLVPESK
ncbi:MAG: septum formation initiator family protein [Nitrospirales bacterium]|nr:septum formation initiator family protein [Nitrospirales bacterium]